MALTVIGASTPGTRCRIEAAGDGAPMTLWVPIDRCPLAAGDAIVVAAADLTPQVPLLSARATAHLSTAAVFTTHRDDGEIYWHAVASMRQWAWEASRGDRGRAFVAGSAIGLVSAMPPEDRAGVRRAGIGHLIAISGMHVGFLALVVLRTLQRVLGPLGVGPRVAVAVSWIPVVAYVAATGAAAPAVRAAVMLAVVGAGGVLGRPTHGLTVVAMAATAMLFVEPSWAVDPGFQLSVAAMVALVRMPPDAGLVHVSWQLQWAVLPVALVHFGPPAAGIVIANLLALPIFTTWVMPLAALGAIAVPFVGAAAFDPAAAGAELILLVAGHAAALPPVPSWGLAAVAALAIALRLFGIRRAVVPSFAAATCVLGVLAFAPSAPARTGADQVPDAVWFALGGWRRPTVVAVGDGAACIKDAGDDPRRWPERLDTLGIETVAVSWTPTGDGTTPPHVAELLAELDRSGRLGEGECRFPDAAAARSAVRACARLRGAHSGAAAVGRTRSWCWLRGQWQPVRLESEVQDGD
jgi:ComEC/Rec2-related protein